MFDIFFTDQNITDYRSTTTSNKAMNKIFDRTLLENGIFKPAGKMYIGMRHDEHDIEQV
mgnify:CR=1 FL=1